MLTSLLLLLPACPVGTSPDAEESESAGEADSGSASCDSAPVVDWDNFGQGFLLQSCQGCHASTAADRYGAPEDVSFDTVEQAWAHADEILGVATGEYPSMPPRGGIDEDDRVRLVWWLACGVPGT